MKNITHIYIANLLIEDLKANKLVLPGIGTYTPPEEVKSAIINNQGAFRAGAVGPDFYPDFIFGQGLIHPYDSGKWIKLMFNRLLISVPAERDKNLAFCLGYMVHYASDMFGHHYVNSYADGWFPSLEDIPKRLELGKIVARHILVEAYMDQFLEDRFSGNVSKKQLDPPMNFIRDVFTCNEAQSLARNILIANGGKADDMVNQLGAFMQLRADVHADLLKVSVGLISWATIYVQNWEEDVDEGVKSWLYVWSRASEIFADTDKPNKFARIEDILVNWLLTKYLSMQGAPDFVGKTLAFRRNIKILEPLRALLKQLVEEFFKAIAKAALGQTYDTIEAAIKAFEDMLKNPKTWLDNRLVFDRYNVSAELKADFGNFGSEKNTTNQKFHALTQCLNMSKLCLLGVDNLNKIVKSTSATSPKYTNATYRSSARIGQIRVKTGTASGAGTDNNVYLGIRYKHSNGRIRKYEVLCDKRLYNDFENGDLDTYPFIIPENVELSTISAITARMSGKTPFGKWQCTWIEIRDETGVVLVSTKKPFWLDTGDNISITDFNVNYSNTSKSLGLDPTIISFLYSLDGKEKDSNANPATINQWQNDFPFYTKAKLREKVFRPLFSPPYPPEITRHPTSATVAAQDNATFTVEANGTGTLTYKWQVASSGDNVFNDIKSTSYTGVSSATLNVKEAARAYNGNRYRCVITNTQGSTRSTTAVLTVIGNPVIKTQPTNQSAVEGKTAKFTASVECITKVTYQWQVSADKSTIWTNISNDANHSGATGQSLSVKNIPYSWDGNRYRIVATNAVGRSANSSAGELTVIILPVITTHPGDFTAAWGGDAEFSIKASGAELSYQWERSNNGTTWSAEKDTKETATASGAQGSKTATLRVKNVVSTMDGYLYRCAVINPAGRVASNEARLTALHLPRITSQPCSKSTLIEKTVVFSLNAVDIEPLKYQWQTIKADKWANLKDDDLISGASTDMLKISNVSESLSGNRYRCMVTNSEHSILSDIVTLTVSLPSANDYFCLNMKPSTSKDGELHHEIHRETCKYPPNEANRQSLSFHESPEEAMEVARGFIKKGVIDGCYYCCREVHKM